MISFITKILLCFIIFNFSYANNVENEIRKAIKNSYLSSIFISIAQQESDLRPYITGKQGEIGLFQIIPSTAKFMKCKGDLYNITNNTKCALKYFNYLRSKFISLERTLRAYNAGEGYCKKKEYLGDWLEHPYVGKILKRMESNNEKNN